MNLLQHLNDRQAEAAGTVHGPLLIIAGAGSGKTRVITYRIAHMLDEGVRQSEILALTFTNKAAREMVERVRSVTGAKLAGLTASTFHAFGVRILRERIGLLGYRENFSIYDQVDRNDVIREAARSLALPRDSLDFSKIGALFSAIKTGRLPWAGGNLDHRSLYLEYQEHLKAYNAVDFDDLIVLTIRVLEEFPGVLEEYRERYRYIMVDEFQDTSLSQYRIVRLLGEKHRNVCVVGDDDQSIYSWRGANYQNIVFFERDFPERAEIKLEQNYRSTRRILDAANALIAHNKDRKPKELWTGGGEGKAIELSYPESDADEARFIAETIRTHTMRDKLAYGQFGVLVRTNGLTAPIEEAFLSENIPYRVSGGTSFFQRKEVKDIISYLRVLANRDDDVNLLRIINTPRRGIGRRTLQQLRDLAESRSCSLFAAIEAVRRAPESQGLQKGAADLDELVGTIETHRELIRSGSRLSETARSLVTSLDYWGYLVAEYQKNERIATWKFANITRFLDMIERWENDPDTEDPGLFAFLSRITLVTSDEDDDDGEKGKVNLSTIHAAKGLEFEIVLLAGVEDAIIPHARALEEGSLEEERRLFYVAITRAKQKLIMTSCRKRRVMRETVECSPSPFLAELPEGLVESGAAPAEVDAEEARRYFEALKSRLK